MSFGFSDSWIRDIDLSFQSSVASGDIETSTPKTSSSESSDSNKDQEIVTPNFSPLSSHNSLAEDSVLDVVSGHVCDSETSVHLASNSQISETDSCISQTMTLSLAEPNTGQQLPETNPGIPQNVPPSSNEPRGDQEPPEANVPAIDEWYGMKFVADNIDKTVKTRYMRVDKRNTSLHYMYMYAVRDRVNLTLSSEVPPPVPDDPNLESLLPSQSDHSTLSTHFATHISRIITTYMPFFRENFGDVVDRHIPHLYSADMSKKSHVVSSSTLIYNVTCTN